MSLVRSLLTVASPAGARGRLSVLVLHRVLAGPDPLVPEAIDAERFSEMCRWLRTMFNVVRLDVGMRQLARGDLPARALAITFDDGYADNHDVAMPILKHFDMPATVFVTTGFLDGGCMWNDAIIESFRRTRHRQTDLHELLPPGAPASFPLETPAQRRHALDRVIEAVKYLEPAQRLSTVHRLADHLEVRLPTDLMMRSDQVVALLSGGLQVGAHTVSHPILTRIALMPCGANCATASTTSNNCFKHLCPCSPTRMAARARISTTPAWPWRAKWDSRLRSPPHGGAASATTDPSVSRASRNGTVRQPVLACACCPRCGRPGMAACPWCPPDGAGVRAHVAVGRGRVSARLGPQGDRSLHDKEQDGTCNQTGTQDRQQQGPVEQR